MLTPQRLTEMILALVLLAIAFTAQPLSIAIKSGGGLTFATFAQADEAMAKPQLSEDYLRKQIKAIEGRLASRLLDNSKRVRLETMLFLNETRLHSLENERAEVSLKIPAQGDVISQVNNLLGIDSEIDMDVASGN